MKRNLKRLCAGILAAVTVAVAVLPNIGTKEAQAYQSKYGVCIDNQKE